MESNAIRDKLLKERIVFLGTPIDDNCAEQVIAQLLFLENEDSYQDVSVYINSPSGSIPASMAIYDVFNSIKPDITTICAGQAIGTAALLVAAGAKRKRFAQPSAQFTFVPFAINEKYLAGKSVQEIDYAVKELNRVEKMLTAILSTETGISESQIQRDVQNRLTLTAKQAVAYGLIDEVLESPKDGK